MNPNQIAALAGLAAGSLAAAGAHLILERHRRRLRRLAGGTAGPGRPAAPDPGAPRRAAERLAARLRAVCGRGSLEARRRRIAREVPFLLDLLVICADGGMNLHQSLATAADLVGGPLGEGLSHLRRDLDWGAPLPAALEALARRLDTEEVRALVRILKIGQALGTPVADSLRQASRHLRDRLRLSVEQRLAGAPLKLSLCTLAFFMPPVFVLLLLPNVLNFAGTRW